MILISTEERIELLKNLLADPDDWVSREILSLVYEFEEVDEDQQQRSVASLPKAINSSFVKTSIQFKNRFKQQKLNEQVDRLVFEPKDFK